jgi:hypothetical protein
LPKARQGELSAREEANEGESDHSAHEDCKREPARGIAASAAKLAHLKRKIFGRVESDFRGPRLRRNKINYFASHANDANAGNAWRLI